VSTHTISLQEQLIHKDIPFLRQVLPDFKAVLVKGRSNYLSLRRLRVARERVGLLLSEAHADAQLQQVSDWAADTGDGSKSDLTFQPLPSVWDLVASDSNNCLGKKCPDYKECFYFKARRQVHGANLLIVNHALFFSDLAVRRAGASIPAQSAFPLSHAARPAREPRRQQGDQPGPGRTHCRRPLFHGCHHVEPRARPGHWPRPFAPSRERSAERGAD